MWIGVESVSPLTNTKHTAAADNHQEHRLGVHVCTQRRTTTTKQCNAVDAQKCTTPVLTSRLNGTLPRLILRANRLISALVVAGAVNDRTLSYGSAKCASVGNGLLRGPEAVHHGARASPGLSEWESSLTSTGPMTGTVVLDLSRALAGPHAAMMLGDLGARVIKVEDTKTGDQSRSWGPPYVGEAEAGDSTYFLSCNRNKESVQLNLKKEEDCQTLARLISRADVLIENFRPGVLDRLGLSQQRLQELNPRLVTLSISGFGPDGPDADRPGYDQIAQGESGLMSVTGPSPEEPTRVGVPIGDLLAGIYGAFGVMSALTAREQTGRGCVVHTSLLAALVGAHAFHGPGWTVGGKVGVASGNHHPQIAPYGAFRCADGIIQIAVGSEVQWHRFAELVGLDAHDQRFVDNSGRVAHRSELIPAVEDALSRGTRDKWLSEFTAAGIPAGAIRTIDEVYEWEQTKSQGLLIEVDHRTGGKLSLPGPPLRFQSYSGERLGRSEHMAPPTLGQHNAQVAAWLDATDDTRK